MVIEAVVQMLGSKSMDCHRYLSPGIFVEILSTVVVGVILQLAGLGFMNATYSIFVQEQVGVASNLVCSFINKQLYSLA